jgi:hypothetical protein
MQKARRKRMTQREVFEIGRRLGGVFVKANEGWFWKEGYNDERIAIECGIPGISAAHVKRLRRGAFGEAAKPSQRVVFAAAVEQINALQQQVTKLMDTLEVPINRSRLH